MTEEQRAVQERRMVYHLIAQTLTEEHPDNHIVFHGPLMAFLLFLFPDTTKRRVKRLRKTFDGPMELW